MVDLGPALIYLPLKSFDILADGQKLLIGELVFGVELIDFVGQALHLLLFFLALGLNVHFQSLDLEHLFRISDSGFTRLLHTFRGSPERVS